MYYLHKDFSHNNFTIFILVQISLDPVNKCLNKSTIILIFRTTRKVIFGECVSVQVIVVHSVPVEMVVFHTDMVYSRYILVFVL